MGMKSFICTEFRTRTEFGSADSLPSTKMCAWYVDLYNPFPDYFFPKCLVNGFNMELPDSRNPSRAAIAADGSIFVTSFAGGTPMVFLYKFTPQLAVAWQFPLPKGSSDNGPAIGPDGTVYACSG